MADTPYEKLKREAQRLKKSAKIPNAQALETIAKKYGFQHWHEVVKRLGPQAN